MKLEVGMYVRTNKGNIGKITVIKVNEYNSNQIWLQLDDDMSKDGFFLSNKNIKKASHNLIDLIEVGDYVNGGKVDYVSYNFVSMDISANYGFRDTTIHKSEIKSILTHELYEANCYKVGE